MEIVTEEVEDTFFYSSQNVAKDNSSMFHFILNCTMTHKNQVALVIKDYKLIEEFLDSDFF